jgi:flagellar FliL protein
VAEEVEEKKDGGNFILIIVIVVLVLILVIGGIIAMLMMDDEEEDDRASYEETSENEDRKETRKSRKKVSRNTESLTVGPMYPLDNFIVNLLSEGGRRYLKVQMNLELEGEELAEELDTKVPVIRDLIIRIMSSKTIEEISTAKGKEKLKNQLVNKLNMRIKDGQLQNIYFTEFVIQ